MRTTWVKVNVDNAVSWLYESFHNILQHNVPRLNFSTLGALEQPLKY